MVSWTLNGLDVCTQNAVVRTSEDGQAHNTFWLTKRGTGGLRRAEAGLPQNHSIQSAAEGWGWLADAPAALHSQHAVLRCSRCNALSWLTRCMLGRVALDAALSHQSFAPLASMHLQARS